MALKLAGPALLAALVAGGAAFSALAASYPERPVRLIAAQSAGSSLDTIICISCWDSSS